MKFNIRIKKILEELSQKLVFIIRMKKMSMFVARLGIGSCGRNTIDFFLFPWTEIEWEYFGLL